MNKDESKILYKPFVKWVGGKRQLLPELFKRLPIDLLSSGNVAYVEPFVGGGALLFELLNHFKHIPSILVNDLNERLICAYRVVREHSDELIAQLRLFAQIYHASLGEQQKAYYLAQRERFNTGKLSDIEQAALFIFLNRTCFNGLYRENATGSFNVPFGKSKNPAICTPELFLADAKALQNVDMMSGDFALTLEAVKQTSFFYLDPPYKPISRTSSFNTYVKTPFDDTEQIRLCEFCREINRRGHLFLLSNSDPGEGYFDELYEGFRIERVKAKRCVNANAAKRGALDELLISNF